MLRGANSVSEAVTVGEFGKHLSEAGQFSNEVI